MNMIEGLFYYYIAFVIGAACLYLLVHLLNELITFGVLCLFTKQDDLRVRKKAIFYYQSCKNLRRLLLSGGINSFRNLVGGLIIVPLGFWYVADAQGWEKGMRLIFLIAIWFAVEILLDSVGERVLNRLWPKVYQNLFRCRINGIMNVEEYSILRKVYQTELNEILAADIPEQLAVDMKEKEFIHKKAWDDGYGISPWLWEMLKYYEGEFPPIHGFKAMA